MNTSLDRTKTRLEISFLLLMVGALLVRLVGLIAFFSLDGNISLVDTPAYVESARTLIAEAHFTYDAFRTPLYPALIALCMRLFGEQYFFGVIAVQIVCNLVAVAYVWRLTMLLTQKRAAAIVAAGIAAVNFLDIVYSFFILPDSLTQSLALISMYYFTRSLIELRSGKRFAMRLIIGGVLLMLAILARPSLMYLPYALMIGFTFAALLTKRARAIPAIVLILAVLGVAPVQAWSARNARVADFNGYSTVSEINLLHFNAAAVYAKQNGVTHYEAQAKLEREDDELLQEYMKEMPRYEAYHKRAMELIFSDLPFYLKTCLKDCVYLTVYPGVMRFSAVKESMDDVIRELKAGSLSFGAILKALKSANVFCLILLGLDVLALLLIAGFACVGAALLLKRNWLTACLILGVVLYNYVVGCQPVLIGAYARFRMSYSMIALPLTGAGVEWVFRAKQRVKA